MAPPYTAFLAHRQIAAGDFDTVAQAASIGDHIVLIFDDATGEAVDVDPRRGATQTPLANGDAEAASPRADDTRARGRPRLGVVSREVTLLPRHWTWLAQQPGGASAALRRLVETAQRTSAEADRERAARDAVYRVMSALAGDFAGFEEAARAWFAADDSTFDSLVAAWPADVAGYVTRLASVARAARQVGR